MSTPKHPDDPWSEPQLPAGPPPLESVDGPLYDDLDLDHQDQAERAMRMLVDRALGEYWLLEGPTMASALCTAVLCTAVRRRQLPDALPECDAMLEQLSSQYAQVIADAVEDGFETKLAAGELPLLTLVRLLVTDAAQGQLPAPLWSLLYAIGGVHRQAAALLLVTQLLADALEGDAMGALSATVLCSAYDLVQVLTEGQIEELGEQAALERLDALALLLGSAAQLAKQYAELVEGVRDLAGMAGQVLECPECRERLERFGDPTGAPGPDAADVRNWP